MKGGKGSIVATSEKWTVDTMTADCFSTLRLYCIEVSP